MFKLGGKLTFINVDQAYVEKLHDACPEVFYKPKGYENKPYIGILVDKNDRKYVIPLSSAKEKHKRWKNIENERYLIYELSKKSRMSKDDIWVDIEMGKVKHILAVLDVKKMIPIIDGVYSRANINPEKDDTDETKRYKDLLNKEYSFCLKIINEVVDKANRLYDKQMRTGKVAKFCCDFKALEYVAEIESRKK